MLAPFSEATPDAAMLALCRDSLALFPEFVAELRERTGVETHGLAFIQSTARDLRRGDFHCPLEDMHFRI